MGSRWNDGRRFEARVAVITGGGGTLGGAVARGFGSEGASVAIGYRSSRSRAAEVVAELEDQGGRAHSGPLDVTDQGSVDAFVADVVERYGRLDVLVNAAGRLDEARDEAELLDHLQPVEHEVERDVLPVRREAEHLGCRRG